jgi:hypothetical protein
MMRWLLLLWFLPLAACGPEPTPFPVTVPQTPTVEPEATSVPLIRYAFSGNTAGLVEELELIESKAQVEIITGVVDPAELGTRFDLVATYGAFEGWSRSPVNPQVMLVINPNAEPLTPGIADVIRRSIQPQSIVETIGWPGMTPSVVVTTSALALREELANLGYPDGVNLALGHTHVPGSVQLEERLGQINMSVRSLALGRDELESALREGRVHLALVSWVDRAEQSRWQDLFGAAFTAELYNLPISYLEIPQLRIEFTPGGWPVGSWVD